MGNEGELTMYKVLWTQEHETTIVKQWERGLSATKIADELSRILGAAVTRNMVIGKVDRLRKDGLVGAREEANHALKLSREIKTPRTPRPKKQFLPKPDPLHIPMDALTKFSCTWTFGDPREEDFNYCGLSVERGSFCAQHAALAYRQTTPRIALNHKRVQPRALAFGW
jgi:GcrA cell cycle regulator